MQSKKYSVFPFYFIFILFFYDIANDTQLACNACDKQCVCVCVWHHWMHELNSKMNNNKNKTNFASWLYIYDQSTLFHLHRTELLLLSNFSIYSINETEIVTQASFRLVRLFVCLTSFFRLFSVCIVMCRVQHIWHRYRYRFGIRSFIYIVRVFGMDYMLIYISRSEINHRMLF